VDNRRLGIFVLPFPGPGLRRQITSDGNYPVWRKDGKEILYLDRKQISSIPVIASGDDVRFGSPSALFEVRSLNTVSGRNPLAVTRDGSRIFFSQAAEQTEGSDVIHVRSGWEIKKP